MSNYTCDDCIYSRARTCEAHKGDCDDCPRLGYLYRCKCAMIKESGEDCPDFVKREDNNNG